MRAVTHASNVEVVLNVAQDDDVDLVAMTTRGAGGATRMIFGSVADVVLRRASGNVLVLRPPPEDGPSPSAGADVRPEPSAG